MRPMTFEHSSRGSLHRYAYLPGVETVVEHPNWPVLTSTWPGGERTPYLQHAVNNNSTEEIAVYVGLIWQLTDGLARYAIPNYEPFDAARWLGRPCEFVSWEYEVDAEAATVDARDKGFVPARSVVPSRPAPTSFELEHEGHAGVFRINTRQDLVTMLHATLRDAEAEMTIFGLADTPPEHLIKALRSADRPDLGDILRDRDLAIDLTIGVDLGYYDSLLVWSHADPGVRLRELAHRFEAAVEAYEKRVPQTMSVDALLDELDQLVEGRP